MKQKIALDPLQTDAIEVLSGEPPHINPEEEDELLDEAVNAADEVEEIGDAFGISYDLSEELFCGEKDFEHDRHRWELDPASSEDYHDRCRRAPGAWRWRHFSH